MVDIKTWKLSKNEKAIIADALDGGSFYEEADCSAFGWTNAETAGLTKEEFNKAITSLKKKGYISSYSEKIGDGTNERVWWLMSLVGQVAVDREVKNPFNDEEHEELTVKPHVVSNYESVNDKVKAGDTVLGYEVRGIEGRRLYGVQLETGKIVTFGLWTNRSTAEERIRKAKEVK